MKSPSRPAPTLSVQFKNFGDICEGFGGVIWYDQVRRVLLADWFDAEQLDSDFVADGDVVVDVVDDRHHGGNVVLETYRDFCFSSFIRFCIVLWEFSIYF